jgi:hypothetical protein
MSSRDFVFWINGFFEIRDLDGTAKEGLCPKQVEMIKQHLRLVFKHEFSGPVLTETLSDKKEAAKLADLARAFQGMDMFDGGGVAVC